MSHLRPKMAKYAIFGNKGISTGAYKLVWGKKVEDEGNWLQCIIINVY